jgi:hypothetical protein
MLSLRSRIAATVILGPFLSAALTSFRPGARVERCAFLPENGILIPAATADESSADDSAMIEDRVEETRFQGLLTQLQQQYDPVFRAAGRTLTVQADWNDARVNAYATRDELQNPVLVAPGGLARFPGVTSEALTAIFCHELGHFLGGAPKARRGSSEKLSWSSAEGQADYFAATKCMKRLFSDAVENRARLARLPAERQSALRETCGTDTQCMRIAAAGEDAARVYAAIRNARPPSLRQRDGERPAQVNLGHPSPQCRLDTFVSGALCDAPAEADFDERDPEVGACRSGTPGARPGCWYPAI